MTNILFLLTAYDGVENDFPLAVYADEAAARAEGERLKAEYARTAPDFKAWCKKRWAIVEQRRKAGGHSMLWRPNEQEITSLIGPKPETAGYLTYDVVQVEDRLSPPQTESEE